MDFVLKPTKFFLSQLDELSDKAVRIVEDKLKLLKVNPFRNKANFQDEIFIITF